jgi:enoyl-CoA hydratase/carnithine racemase
MTANTSDQTGGDASVAGRVRVIPNALEGGPPREIDGPGRYETVLVDESDHVVTLTLDRPERLNAFSQQMCEEFAHIWGWIREDDDVHAVVLRAAGDRAFSVGADQTDRVFQHPNIWSAEDPGNQLSPKFNDVWKPVVCAVQGMAAGGAFYWINESDIVICSEDATFFEPHVTYGKVAALEPIGLAHRAPLGEVLRMALLGNDERMSAQRALQIGLVSEVVPREQLWDRAADLATRIAEKPPIAVQGTVRAIWESMDVGRREGLRRSLAYTQMARTAGTGQVDQRPKGRKWELR